MRGKGLDGERNAARRRITPAYAGKRSALALPAASTRDHPRLCGEKAINADVPANAKGSPPPMRGKVYSAVSTQFSNRITHAYAGKRPETGTFQMQTKDHPRLCGEKLFMDGEYGARIGSPPPMRGKAETVCCPACQQGITPAYAGKRIRLPVPLRSTRDHPRLCGEKLYFVIADNTVVGSPPPMRGKETAMNLK